MSSLKRFILGNNFQSTQNSFEIIVTHTSIKFVMFDANAVKKH